MIQVRRALLSVYDKTGLVDLARGLAEQSVEMLSTGGTFRAIESAGLPVRKVSDVTGFPEILGGRVKTLHPKIHGGILADRRDPEHVATLAEHGIGGIDLVVVNLYPFRDAAATPGASDAEVVEMIDIGGPTMVRAAAKNHANVAIVVDPADYAELLEALASANGCVEADAARRLARKAFAHTAAYDHAIAGWMAGDAGADAAADDSFPERLTIDLERSFEPRYGENPHQAAAVYVDRNGPGLLGGFEQFQGKELSFNNLLDADAARRIAGRFARPVTAIIKHNNPCGVGLGETPTEAYERALACDPVSAFGSIVAVNRTADEDLAAAMAKLFVEVVLAPDYTPEALEVFARKKNLRVLRCPIDAVPGIDLRAVRGGFLAQQGDDAPDPADEWRCVTEREPSASELVALDLAWRVAREVKSNAIVLANDRQTVGIGAGQMSRVDSCRIAVDKAQLPVAGTAAGSDAFFPFPDGVEALAAAGVTAVAQPGGSKRDDEVITAADRLGLTMVLTGRRHFRH